MLEDAKKDVSMYTEKAIKSLDILAIKQII